MIKASSTTGKLHNIDQISPWLIQNKQQLFSQNNANDNNQQETNQQNKLKDDMKTTKFWSQSVPRLSSFRTIKPITQDFDKIPRVYRIFQRKIRQSNQKPQSIYRKDSECYSKEIRVLPLNYQQFKLNKNTQFLPIQSKSSGKMMNPQRFYSRKEQSKYKQGLDQILRKTLKTPAVCSRIKIIVKQNMVPNTSARKYSVPTGFTNNHCGYNQYERSRSELRKTSILFRPNVYTVEKKMQRTTNKKKFMIRIQKKHILDKVLQRYQD